MTNVNKNRWQVRIAATIIFVLERALKDLRPGQWALAVGFGPGFAIELSLWRGVRSDGA